MRFRNFRNFLASVFVLSLCGVLPGSVLAATPASESRFDDGMRAFQSGQLSQALLLFQDATQIDPTNTTAWFNLGSVQYQMRSFDGASASFQQVLQRTPTDPQALYLLGLSQSQLGQLPQAIATLERVPANAPIYAQAQAEARQLQSRVMSFNPLQATSRPVQPSFMPPNIPSSGQNKPSWQPFTQAKPQVAAKPDTLQSEPFKKPAVKPVAASVQPSGKKAPVETIARGFSGPTGMAIAPDGSLFVANYSKNSIDKITPGGFKSVLIEGKGLSGPVGVVRHPASGDLIVANYLGNNLVRISSSTGKLSELAGGLKKPYYLTLDTASNVVYVSEQGSNTISRIILPK